MTFQKKRTWKTKEILKKQKLSAKKEMKPSFFMLKSQDLIVILININRDIEDVFYDM